MVATSWSAAAASVATAKSPPMAEARPSTARQAPGRWRTRSAIVAVIAGGTRSSASRERAAVEEADRLGDEQRVAPRPLDQRVDVDARELARSELARQRGDVGAGQRFEHDLAAEPAQLDQRRTERGRRRRVLRPVGHEQAGPTLPGRGRVVDEHRHGGRVGPVGVVENTEHGRARRGVANPAARRRRTGRSGRRPGHRRPATGAGRPRRARRAAAATATARAGSTPARPPSTQPATRPAWRRPARRRRAPSCPSRPRPRRAPPRRRPRRHGGAARRSGAAPGRARAAGARSRQTRVAARAAQHPQERDDPACRSSSFVQCGPGFSRRRRGGAGSAGPRGPDCRTRPSTSPVGGGRGRSSARSQAPRRRPAPMVVSAGPPPARRAGRRPKWTADVRCAPTRVAARRAARPRRATRSRARRSRSAP